MPFQSGHSSLSRARAVQVHAILNIRNVNISSIVETMLQFLDKIFIHLKSTRGQLSFKLWPSKHAFNSISHSITMETPQWNWFHQPKSYCAHIQQEVEVPSFKVSSFIPILKSLGCLIYKKPYNLRLLQMKYMYINYHATRTTGVL